MLIGDQSTLTVDLEHYEKLFSKLSISGQDIEGIIFENCRFVECNFKELTFKKCKFIDCYFKSCEFHLLKLKDSSFNEVEFSACKMTGVNWTEARWPNISLISPIHFADTDISFSSFYGLKLTELSMISCKAQDVDFRECDLTNANFARSNLEKAEFMHTLLNGADFRQAVNYIIDPLENTIKKAKFTFPDVVGLLYNFDLEIENL